MSHTLYLTRNGLLEPLGQSQVFAYLRGLSRDHTITLITYEKPDDWADSARVARARAACEAHGIRWLPQRFRKRPRIISPALSMLRMAWLVWREVRGGRAELIHARSYIPAAVALAVHRLTGVPFIFDMRALWPEELITAGRLRRGSLLHKAIAWVERACLARGAAVVSLTHAAVAHLHHTYPQEFNGQRIAVIPTCADLERFTPASDRPEGPRVHGCIGTVLSGWFRTDWLASWLAVAAKRDASARFEIVTRDDAEQVRQALDPERRVGERLTIGPRAPEEMPEAVRGHDLSIMFYAGGEVSELGRSPTRMAEVLGCGLPVVANVGVGDVAAIINEWRVGVLVEGPEPAQIGAALDALDDLSQDPELPDRCRRAAEAIFSLDAGTEAYRALYAKILTEQHADPVSIA
ncbi:glycosyltransferase [Halomonas icarae]|uniref:Glycosyltransferase n=1 Tax=Halomonas icarae TaxID=2691040 RepID=A0A7X5ALD9_9GAMM|nr:glycosyltransferase [Halomonas icarae]MDR5903027.1 glycosyltransferase [Halomonas icarae]NAW11583.1 glycosyltransferase [Halomonas icarae]